MLLSETTEPTFTLRRFLRWVFTTNSSRHSEDSSQAGKEEKHPLRSSKTVVFSLSWPFDDFSRTINMEQNHYGAKSLWSKFYYCCNVDFTYLSGNPRKHFHHFRSSNLNFNLDSAYLDRDLVGLIIHGIIQYSRGNAL